MLGMYLLVHASSMSFSRVLHDVDIVVWNDILFNHKVSGKSGFLVPETQWEPCDITSIRDISVKIGK